MAKRLWIIGLCVAAGGAWYFFHSPDGSDSGSNNGGRKGKNAVVPVGLATAKTQDISVYLDGLGNITPRSTVTIHTLINGQLMKILFTEGQIVKKDDLLAQIDDRPYVAVLEQAEGMLTRDQALLAEAKTNLVRYQDLWKKDSIAKQQLDTQISLVKQYEGAVRNDQGQVDAAKTNLIYTRITSPVTGRVGLRQVDEGNIVHTSDTNGIAIVTELQPITAIFTIPEDNIPSVQKHINGLDKLAAEAWDRSNKNKLATGVLTAIDNQVDPSTGTVKFRAEFANDDNSLFPSQFVNIRLKLDTLSNVVTIPTSAVQRGVNGPFVYKVTDKLPEDGSCKSSEDKVSHEKGADEKSGKGPPRFVLVQNTVLGPGEGDNVSVAQGVIAGDQVVVDGADSLRNCAKIDIASTDGKPAAGDKDTKKEGVADYTGESEKPHHHKRHSDNPESGK